MNKELLKRILSSIILLPLALFFIIKGSYLFIFFILLCFCIIAYEWHLMSKNKKYYIPGLIFLFFSIISIYCFRIHLENYIFFLFVVTICVSTDIGGFVFGKIFKGPKLTKFSPNKTYYGMFGGFILSLIIIAIVPIFHIDQIGLSEILLIVSISSISQIGDIIISFFKRLSNVKDTGKIIPGHGGLLDRVDGMIFAIPFAYFLDLLGYLK